MNVIQIKMFFFPIRDDWIEDKRTNWSAINQVTWCVFFYKDSYVGYI